MPEPIRSKEAMYAALNAGRFGNTVPAFVGLAAWQAREPLWEVPLWGVRSMSAGDRRARLDVPTAEVADYCRSAFGASGFNISPMVDHMLTWRGEVYDGPGGLVCCGAFGLKHLKWRPVMKEHAVETRGVAARMLLRSILNENSHADLMELLELYPSHVVEFTALDRPYGTHPHRNGVCWEVRCGTTGDYELSTWRKYL